MNMGPWLWWPLEKAKSLFLDMSTLLRRNLTYLMSAFWGRRSIAPPPPKSASPSPKNINQRDYLTIDMEPVNKLESQATEELVHDQGDETVTLKRDFCSISTASTSLLPSFPLESGRSGLNSKRPKLTHDERKEKRLRAKEKRKIKLVLGNKTIDVMENESQDSSRPNYFVAFRVSNAEILENVRHFQERMLSRPVTTLPNCKSGQIFKETLIPLQKMHFTLHVMQLRNEEQITTATEALKSVFRRVKQSFREDPLHIPIKGVGHFRNSVLFAKIHGDDPIRRVENVSILVKNELEASGLQGDTKSFKPHMTIAKMSKAKKLYKKKIRAFPREIWEADEDTNFGHQWLEGLELLSMMETDPVTKYYKCIAQFQFQE